MALKNILYTQHYEKSGVIPISPFMQQTVFLLNYQRYHSERRNIVRVSSRVQ